MTRPASVPHRQPIDALRVWALDEAERAQLQLARGDATGIHELRKCCKRLRALSRLLRDADDDLQDPGKTLNAWLRAAADAVAEARGAAVAVDTFAALPRPDSMAAAAWAHIAMQLRARRAALDAALPAMQHEAGTALRRAVQLLAELQLPSLKPRRLRAATQRSLKRCQRAWQAAQRDPQATTLHEWRKTVKRLGHQLALLDHALDGISGKALDPLADLLGAHHDLDALLQLLRGDMERYGGTAALQPTMALVQQRMAALQREALAVGEKLFD